MIAVPGCEKEIELQFGAFMKLSIDPTPFELFEAGYKISHIKCREEIRKALEKVRKSILEDYPKSYTRIGYVDIIERELLGEGEK